MNVPHGWSPITIEAAAGSDGLMTDGDWIETKDQDVNGEVRLIQLADIGDGQFLNKSSRFLTADTAERLNCTYLRAGDVLIARMPDPLGRACVFPDLGQPAVTAVDVCVWRGGRDGADPVWLMYAINAPNVRSHLATLAGGTTRQRISGGNLKRFIIPVPPIAEQRQIAARVTELFSAICHARADLRRAEAMSQSYPTQLLSLSLAEAGGTDRAISDVAEIITGKTPPTKDRENFGGDTPFVKPTDLDVGYVVNGARESLSRAGLRHTRLLPAGATLVTCIGATIGKTGYARVPCATNQQINALIPDRDIIDPRWLYWWAISADFQQQIRSNSSATTLPIINKGRFQDLRLTVPDVSVQRRVILKLEDATKTIEDIQQNIKRALVFAPDSNKQYCQKPSRASSCD